jgi:small subunit ribosomal protein S3
VGHKVNPIGYRLGYIKNWRSRWFAPINEVKKYIKEDYEIRAYIKENLKYAGVADVEIERYAEKVVVIIYTARPGVIIGRRGAGIEKIEEDLQELIKDKELAVEIKEVKNPETHAQLVAENVAFQIVKRVSHRRAMKRAIQMAMESKVKGIKIVCSGRLGGVEIARSENYKEGKIPLQTLKADIDYGFAEAKTTYGVIGVKVWIYGGEQLDKA